VCVRANALDLLWGPTTGGPDQTAIEVASHRVTALRDMEKAHQARRCTTVPAVISSAASAQDWYGMCYTTSLNHPSMRTCSGPPNRYLFISNDITRLHEPSGRRPSPSWLSLNFLCTTPPAGDPGEGERAQEDGARCVLAGSGSAASFVVALVSV
jgi:hypothetical protein